MRKYLAALVILALGVGFTGYATAGRGIKSVQGRWYKSANTATGYTFQSTVDITGAPVSTDTVYFDLSSLVWDNGALNTTAFGCARLWFTTSANTSVDTLFYAVEVIAPDGTVIPSTSFNNAIAVTAADKAIAAAITCDADAVIPNLAWAKAVRLRVRCDGNSAARWPNAKAFLTFYAQDETFHP